MPEPPHVHTCGNCNLFLSVPTLIHIDLIHPLERLHKDSISQISHHLFSHFPNDLSYSQLGAITNDIIMKIFIQPPVVPKGMYPGRHLSIFLNALSQMRTFLLSAPPCDWINLHPCPWAWNFPLFIILSTLGILRHNFFPNWWIKNDISFLLICIFLIISEVEHLIPSFHWPFMFPLQGIVHFYFAHFSCRLFVFFSYFFFLFRFLLKF